MHGCSGACVIALGGVCGCSWGACMVALGGMRGCSRGVCVVAQGGHAWLLWGGVRGFFDEIRSMSGRYASYWNAFLFLKYIFEVESMATLSFVSFLAFGSLSLILSVRLSKPCYFEFVGHIA